MQNISNILYSFHFPREKFLLLDFWNKTMREKEEGENCERNRMLKIIALSVINNLIVPFAKMWNSRNVVCVQRAPCQFFPRNIRRACFQTN